MEFCLESLGGFRHGKWISALGELAMTTPGCMLYTRAGVVPSLGVDLLTSFSNLPNLCQLSLASSYNQPSAAVLEKLNKTHQEYYGLKRHSNMAYVSVQDPVTCADHTFNETKNVSIQTSGHRAKITPEIYMSYMKASRPDIFECLCDTLPTSAAAESKRGGKSVDRTLAFLDECLELHRTTPELQKSAVVGAIQGGAYPQHRVRSAKETAKRPVAGFAFEGMEIGDDNLETIVTTLQAAIAELPVDKPRIFHGPASPEDILRLVECGIDIFDASYPYLLAENGIALDIVVPSSPRGVEDVSTNHGCDRVNTGGNDRNTDQCCAAEKVVVSEPSSASVGTAPAEGMAGEPQEKSIDDAMTEMSSSKVRTPTVPMQRSLRSFEINLSDKRYVDDFSSLSANCRCPSCKHGCTKAYLHHLANEGELIGTTRLMQHNLFLYLRFLEAVYAAALSTNPTDQTKAWNRLRSIVRGSVAA